MAHQTQKVDDPESGFYRVHYLQRQPKRKRQKDGRRRSPNGPKLQRNGKRDTVAQVNKISV